MANCHYVFTEFNEIIRLTDDRRTNLYEKRENARTRLTAGYVEVRSRHSSINHQLDFQSQGSYVMDTIINPYNKDEEYDLDDGVYFFGELSKEQRKNKEQHFHDIIVAGLEYTPKATPSEEIKDIAPCVRILYRSPGNEYNYHLDLPIYYLRQKNGYTQNQPELAHVDDKWIESNPVELIAWFEEKLGSGFSVDYLTFPKTYNKGFTSWSEGIRKEDKQLRRIVRYFKAWADHQRFTNEKKMPSGVALTVMAGENYISDLQDDLSILKTAKEIKKWLIENNIKCPRPTAKIGEDLMVSFNSIEREDFLKTLQDFIDQGSRAIKQDSEKAACLKWKSLFGDRFSCANASGVENAYLYGTPGTIKSQNDGSA